MRSALFLFASVFAAIFAAGAYALQVSFVSDLISTSAPSATSTHTLQFRLAQNIPPSGKIIITLEPGAFSIPAGFDFADVDLGVSSSGGGPYTDRSLAATASAADDGVSIVSGASGSITITLNSTTGISAGDYIQIQLGQNATFGASGVNSITNPSAVTSYTIHVETRDASNVLIDSGLTMIAVVSPVGLSATQPIVEPTLFNGLPSGLIAANNTRIELSLETNLLSTCRYATTTGVLYDNMTVQFNPSVGTLHYVDTIGYQNNTTYNYYVRCRAQGGAANTSDYLITFTLKPDPISNTSIETEGFVTSGETGDLGKGGSGDFSSGSAYLYYATVAFSGWSVPGSLITVLKDGVKAGTVTVQDNGSFKTTLTDLERGAYGFQLYTDSAGLTSSLYGTTITLSQGTVNEITNIVIPPTIALSSDSIQAGDDLSVSGRAAPNAKIDLRLEGQVGAAELAEPRNYTASTTSRGEWSISVPTSQFAKGTYALQGTAVRSDNVKSSPSKALPLEVGSDTQGRFNRSDINRDGKVNLIDFSILLSFWQTANPDADINEDGTVNLGDFSIMLFNWTG